MKRERLCDPHLHPQPAVFRVGDTLRMETVAWSPLRVSANAELWWAPVCNVSRLVLGIATAWALGVYAGLWPAPDDLPFDWRLVVGLAAGLLAMSQIERATRFRLFRAMLGRKITIVITKHTVCFGRWPFRREFAREARLGFALVPIEAAVSPFYQDAGIFAVVIGDTRRVKLAEIYDKALLARIVTNANVALAHSANLGGPRGSGRDSVTAKDRSGP